MRVLAALRQSKHRKGRTPDTSPELQRDHIVKWAAVKGWTVIGEAVDLDVSGSKVAPWKRPELGVWLATRRDDFDAICIDSVDRAGRDVEDYLAFQSRHLRPYGKSLYFVTPDVDLSTPEGEHIAISLMAVAQLQARQFGDRMSDVVNSVRSKGQHSGGVAPYGYRLIPCGTGYGYEHDPEKAEIVRRVMADFLATGSISGVADRLNADNVPSPTGKAWSAFMVKHILTSPATAGMMTHAGERVDRKYRAIPKAEQEPLRHPDTGEIVRMVTAPDIPVEPVVTLDEWQKILDTVKANKHQSKRSQGSSLLNVCICGNCYVPMYSAPQTNKGKVYRYVKCSRKSRSDIPGKCVNPVVRAELVESALDEAIIVELGNVPKMDKHVTPADSKACELDFVEKQLATLADALISGAMSPELAGRAEKGLNERREKLISEAHPELVTYTDSGVTFGQYWSALTWPERQKFLVENGVHVYVMYEPKHDLSVLSSRQAEQDGRGYYLVSAGRHVCMVAFGELDSLRKSAEGK